MRKEKWRVLPVVGHPPVQESPNPLELHQDHKPRKAKERELVRLLTAPKEPLEQRVQRVLQPQLPVQPPVLPRAGQFVAKLQEHGEPLYGAALKEAQTRTEQLLEEVAARLRPERPK